MADSDDEYVQDAGNSDDDADLTMTGVDHPIRSHSSRTAPGRRAESGRTRDRNQNKGKRKVAGQARWEAGAQNLGLQEAVDGGITGELERDLEAMKRAR